MSPIHPFGHFFEFAATANYVTTVFKDFAELIALPQDTVDELDAQNAKQQQNFKVAETLESAGVKGQLNEDLMHLKGKQLAAQTAFHKYSELLLERRKNNVVTKFETIHKPLFYLCGTYAVILVLFCGFSQLYENEPYFFNSLMIINLFMFAVACGHHWMFKKSETRLKTIWLNFILIGVVLFSLVVAWSVEKYKWHIGTFHEWSYLFWIIISLVFCGKAFFVLIYSVIRTYYKTNKIISTLRITNKAYETHYNSFTLMYINPS